MIDARRYNKHYLIGTKARALRYTTLVTRVAWTEVVSTKSKMRKIFTLLFCSVMFNALAQGPPAQEATTDKGNAKISGSVVDAESNQPVEFATVALLDRATGKPVDGSICDVEG